MTDSAIIREFLSGHVSVTSRKSDGGFYTTCPLCNKKGKLEVNRDSTLWFCHRCQVGGRLGSFPDTLVETPIEVRNGYEEFLKSYRPAISGSIYWEYLISRRFSNQMIEDVLQPYTGPSYFRVYIPFFMPFDPRPCYFSGRDVVNSTNAPKWSFPRKEDAPCSKSEVLWGLNRIKPGLNNLVLCEGIFDAAWGDNRVALQGKVLSSCQQELIGRIGPNEITIMLDSDAGEEAVELAASLSKHFWGPIWCCDLPPGKDPGDLKEKGEEFIKNRRRLA